MDGDDDDFARLRQVADARRASRAAEQLSEEHRRANEYARELIGRIASERCDKVQLTVAWEKVTGGWFIDKFGEVRPFNFCDPTTFALKREFEWWAKLTPKLRADLAQACWDDTCKRLPHYLEAVYENNVAQDYKAYPDIGIYVPYVLRKMYSLRVKLAKLSSLGDEPRQVIAWTLDTTQVKEAILPSCKVAAEYGDSTMISALEKAVGIIARNKLSEMQSHCGFNFKP